MVIFILYLDSKMVLSRPAIVEGGRRHNELGHKQH